MAYSQADFLGYTTGDILYASATDVLSKRAIGTSGQVLTVSGGVPTWSASSSVGAMVQLQAWTVLGGSSTTISIGSISGSYKNLMLVCALRSDRAASNDNVYVRFNSDSTAGNYYSYTVRTSGTGATHTITERLGVTATGIEMLASATGSTAPSGYRSHFVLHIADYTSTTTQRKITGEGSINIGTTTGNLLVLQYGGQWENTSNAITQIDLLPVTGTNFVAGSAYALYAY